MNNISSNKNCFGCGVCAIVCPHKLISIELSADGFYVPVIKLMEQCTHCGLCVKVCSYLDENKTLNSLVLASYAAYIKKTDIRKLASSGGVAYAISDSLVRKGYKICAVRYNYENHQAEHYVANTPDELLASLGSKYMQSYSLSGLNYIITSDKYMVVGTPCMIASMRKFVELKRISDNFVLVDFFCHGVPSKLLWNKYLKNKEKKIGKIHYISWRNKEHGWHNSYNMVVKGDKMVYAKSLEQGDVFYKFFLGDYCLNEACYSKCRFKKTSSAADIRIGDLWGDTYAKNDEGFSALLVYTKNGENALSKSQDLVLKEESEHVITEGQMNELPVKPFIRRFVMYFLTKNCQNWWGEIITITIVEIYYKLVKVITRPHIVIKNRLKCLSKN